MRDVHARRQILTLLSLCVFNISAKNIDATASISKTARSSSTKVYNHSASTSQAAFLREERSNGDRYTRPLSSTLETTPLFTRPYAVQSSECLNNATTFVYQKNLCDASDPNSYVANKKAVYSCENRCDKIRPFKIKGGDWCACDADCVVHADCCRDMAQVCPETYARGTSFHASIGRPQSLCGRGTTKVFECKTMNSDEYKKHVSNTNDIPYSPWEMAFFHNQHQEFPLPSRRLGQLTSSQGQFSVVDITSGMIFKDFQAFESCAGPESVPYFLPMIVSLDCSAIKSTADRTRASRVLQWCRERVLNDVKTPFHRSCFETRLIICHCSRDSHFIDHLHNACIGANASVAHLRYKLWNYQVQTEDIVAEDTPCAISSYGSYANPDIGDTRISISILLAGHAQKAKAYRQDIAIDNPTSFSNKTTTFSTSRLNNHNFNVNNNEESSTGIDTNSRDNLLSNSSFDRRSPPTVPQKWFQANSPVTREDLRVVVEFSWTVERRLLCRSLYDYVSQCQILDCAHGAILSQDPDRGGDFGGSRCLWPSHIIVKPQTADRPAPLCWCMRVLAVLTELRIWSINMRSIDKHQCFLNLTVRHIGKSKFVRYLEITIFEIF
ncbi:hypothetical protein ElyMa_001603700 [Elysia marginata]|uniref:SMB domain-containing protein n=1 Tax=Elysia marginata TaxID=1093978 RepID=A0AAV4JIE3_9GAST|nr:hypothetical protein ElyMa_001603700 [Elysia marginata]